MDGHQIEPIALLGIWSEELHSSVAEGTEEALVSDIAHAVQRELRMPFLEENGFDRDIIRLGGAAVVVHQTRDLKEV
jgi:hypothetical protein